MPADKNDFAPRAGLAWNAMKNLVVRAGYAISYQGSVIQAGPWGNMVEGYKSSTSITASFYGMQTINARLQNPFPQGFNLPLGLVLSGVYELPVGNVGRVLPDVRNPVLVGRFRKSFHR